MKIFVSIPGTARTIPMGLFVPRALAQLNHEVKVFNHEYDNLFERIFHKLNKKTFRKYKNKQVLRTIEKFKPDLFFTIYGIPYLAETILKIKSWHIKTACWWLNDPFEFPFNKTDAAPHYDLYCTNSKGAAKVYLQNKVNHYFLPVGIDKEIHRFIPDSPKIYDVFFAGDHHPLREKLLENLLLNGFKVTILGPWKKRLREDSPLHGVLIKKKYFTADEMASYFNQSKIVLNIHTWYGKWNFGINPRLFEASGCHSFQLYDFKEEISVFFENGNDIILYNDINEVPALIEKYLNAENDSERERIATNAYNKAQNNTYEVRMKELLNVVFTD